MPIPLPCSLQKHFMQKRLNNCRGKGQGGGRGQGLDCIDCTTVGLRATLSAAPNHGKGLIFMDHQKKEPPNSMVPKVAETKQPIQVLHTVRTEGSVEAGQGQAVVPPPYASPLVHTPRGKDPGGGERRPHCRVKCRAVGRWPAASSPWASPGGWGGGGRERTGQRRASTPQGAQPGPGEGHGRASSENT